MGKKRIWHLSGCHPSTKKMVGARSSCGGFQDQSFAFKPMKDTNGKKKFKKMLIFVSVDKRELFTMKLCFEEFNLVFFAGIRALGLF